MKNVQILRKSTTCKYSDVLLHLNHIESPELVLFVYSTLNLKRLGIQLQLEI